MTTELASHCYHKYTHATCCNNRSLLFVEDSWKIVCLPLPRHFSDNVVH